jgi:hypothetical protein
MAMLSGKGLIRDLGYSTNLVTGSASLTRVFTRLGRPKFGYSTASAPNRRGAVLRHDRRRAVCIAPTWGAAADASSDHHWGGAMGCGRCRPRIAGTRPEPQTAQGFGIHRRKLWDAHDRGAVSQLKPSNHYSASRRISPPRRPPSLTGWLRPHSARFGSRLLLQTALLACVRCISASERDCAATLPCDSTPGA